MKDEKEPIMMVIDEDWLAETICDSLEMDWTARDAARLILSRLGVTEIAIAKPEPCPKCKNSAMAMQCEGVWAVYCNNDGTLGGGITPCGFEGPSCNTEAESVVAWNTRPFEENRDDK